MRNPLDKLLPLDPFPDELLPPHHCLVATNGCFDILHAGHIRFLCAARALGDLLVVGLNDDESVRALKGEGRPVNRVADRALVLAALECVDAVVVFSGATAADFLREVRPAVWAKASDYTFNCPLPGETRKPLSAEEQSAVYAGGGRIMLLPYHDGHSTTALIERIKR